ncbi:MAG: trimethylamine methyltransferase family protein, partial [Pseudomonadota bacterium]
IIGQALRCVRGIEVTDETLALDQMAQVCMGGPGHYLGTDQTLARMQTDCVYPTFGDRTSPKEWVELGKPDLIAKATARKTEILSQRPPAALDAATDAAIRARFNIHLPAWD